MNNDTDIDTNADADADADTDADAVTNARAVTNTDDIANIAIITVNTTTTNTNTNTNTTVAKSKQKRKSSEINYDFNEHFKDSKTIEKDGVPKHFVVCIHCLDAHNLYRARVKKAKDNRSFSQYNLVHPPKDIHKYRRDAERHIEKCEHYKKKIHQLSKARLSSSQNDNSVNQSQISQLSEPDININSKSSILGYAIKKLTADEGARVKEIFVELQVDAALPLSLGERSSCKALFEILRPGSSEFSPSHTECTRIMHRLATNAQENTHDIIRDLLEIGHYSGYMVDTWQCISKLHIEGILLKAGNRTFVVASNNTDSEHHGLAVARGWDLLIQDRIAEDSNFQYFLSDDAGQCSRARRILALRFPKMLFMRCFAHQVNLMVKAILSKPKFKSIMQEANLSVTTINQSSCKWLAKYRDKAARLYGQSAANKFFSIGDTRWNSAQACFASLLRVQSSCKLLSIEKQAAKDFPIQLVPWTREDFWLDLVEAEGFIRPFCEASFLLQREINTLAHVFLVFLNLFKHISLLSKDYSNADILLLKSDIKRRWQREEHPLFFLTFLLHPEFVDVARKMIENARNRPKKENSLCIRRLTHAAKFYYCKHKLEEGTHDELNLLVRQLVLWIEGKAQPIFPYNINSKDDYNNPSGWWLHERRAGMTELSRQACFLIDCPVQGASCERMFKDMSRQSTKHRNRLLPKTIHAQTILLHRMRRDNANENQNDTKMNVQKGKNRHVVPTEHERKDLIVTSPCSRSLSQLQDEEQEPEVVADDDVEEMEVDESNISEQSLSLALENLHDGDNNNVTLENGDNNNVTNYNYTGKNFDDYEGYIGECRFEDIDIDDLAPLPTENVPNYPQEDHHYLNRKNYVRNDKYELSWFFANQYNRNPVDIPELRHVFGTDTDNNNN